MQNYPKRSERRAKSLSSFQFFKLIPQLKDLSHFLEKVVLLACRSVRKRNKIARSLGQEGNRIARSFGWEGNKNTRRCKGKGIELQKIGMSRKSFLATGKKSMKMFSMNS